MNDKIRPEVVGALHYIRESIKDDKTDPILRSALALLDKTGVFDEIDKARDAAPAAGRHRRALGAGAPAPAKAPDLTPSFADTHPRAAKELGDLIADLTVQPDGVPPAVCFDVDLVYKHLQDNGDWTPSRTSQDTLYAEDQEKALVIAGERLLRKLRRAGSVSHAGHLKIISGTTRAGSDV